MHRRWPAFAPPQSLTCSHSYIPTRLLFLLHTACIIVSSLFLIDIFDNLSDPSTTRKFYSNANIPLFSRWPKVTREELTMRIIGTLFSGIGIVTVQRALYIISAFLCCLQPFKPCPLAPLLRPLLPHLLAPKSMEYVLAPNQHILRFSAISHWPVHGVLGLPRCNIVVRYIRAFVTLFVSGTIHVVLDISARLRLAESGAMRFSCM